jgi:N-acetylmuramoyl-L-alanine amidase
VREKQQQAQAKDGARHGRFSGTSERLARIVASIAKRFQKIKKRPRNAAFQVLRYLGA